MCAREIDLFQAIVKWTDLDRQKRLCHSCDLLKLVRFQHMCMNDLAQKVEFASWIFVDKETKDLLFAAYKFHAMLSSGVVPPGNFRLDKPRCASCNKKKPLTASLNEFRNSYNKKLENCLINQTAYLENESWNKNQVMKKDKAHQISSSADPDASEHVINNGWTKDDPSKSSVLPHDKQPFSKTIGTDPSLDSQVPHPRRFKSDNVGYLPAPVFKENKTSNALVEAQPTAISRILSQPLPYNNLSHSNNSLQEDCRNVSSLEKNLRHLKETLPRGNAKLFSSLDFDNIQAK